jgi:hypothetical protein
VGDVISGTAYGQRATLDISGDSLTWRARPIGELPENIATTVHDVSGGTWLEQRTSFPGLVLVGVGIVWTFTHGPIAGALAGAAGIALFAWRRSRPRRLLVLDLGNRRLVMNVDAPSAATARTLVERIDRALESGEMPATPPSLP